MLLTFTVTGDLSRMLSMLVFPVPPSTFTLPSSSPALLSTGSDTVGSSVGTTNQSGSPGVCVARVDYAQGQEVHRNVWRRMARESGSSVYQRD